MRLGNRYLISLLVAITFVLAQPPLAHADIVRGLMRIVGGVLAIPQGMLAGTMSGPPIVGTVMGAMVGAVKGVGLVAAGALETVISAIPLGAKLAPMIPIFI